MFGGFSRRERNSFFAAIILFWQPDFYALRQPTFAYTSEFPGSGDRTTPENTFPGAV
jgi:hypothetical protein